MKSLIPDKEDQYILFYILSCGLICILPSLTLNIYEFAYPFMLTLQYLSIPFAIISLTVGSLFYLNIWIPKLNRLNKQMNRYLGIGLFSAVVFLGLVFTTINGAIFCNTFVGKQNVIESKIKVIDSYDSTGRSGAVTYHHVIFKHPHQDRLVDIYVKNRYYKGDLLNEKLFTGSLNLIYSF